MPPEVGAVFDCIINTIVQYPVGDRRDNIMAAQISTDWHPIFARARRPGAAKLSVSNCMKDAVGATKISPHFLEPY